MIKKVVLNLTLILVILFVLDLAIGKVLRFFYFKETSGLHFRTTYSMDSTKAEILVFGSSRANHHYVPEIFEDSLKMSFYNTGRDGNGILFQTALLASVLKRYSPKVIILDFDEEDYEKGNDTYDGISSLLPYYRAHSEIQKFIDLKSPREKIKMLSEIYPFNSEIITIAMGNLNINKKRNADNKGYIALNNKLNTQIDTLTTSTIVEVDSMKIKLLEGFISMAKKSGAMVFVFKSPIYLKYKAKNGFDLCNNVCRLQNVLFWNFSKDAIFLNNGNLFHDKGHLNQDGAVIFSNLVVEKIKHELVN